MLVVTLACGCRSTMAPKMSSAMSAPSITEYKADEFKTAVENYRKEISERHLADARDDRDRIANRVMADIELRYSKFEMELTTTRAGFETGADMIQLGGTAATGLVGASEVKDLLAASLTAFQGSRLSVDKNFFREKTTESIISQMRSSRDNKKSQIMKSLANRDVKQYPWDAAWIDLVDLYYAGTVPSALVEIATATGKKADDAATKLKTTVAALTLRTPDQAKQAVDINKAYYQLQAALADPAKKDAAIKSLKNILDAVRRPTDDNASASDLLDSLIAEMNEAKTNADKLEQLKDAIAAEKIE
jgi:hypothetical protein